MPSKHPLASRTDLELIELAGSFYPLSPEKNGSLLYDSIIKHHVVTLVSVPASFRKHLS